ncbi:hypothetical protein SAMN02745121_03908 [Nannocystis exedens]|uniref:Uncharacterized protein n=1 Tax=Nannocystis exedens TaxID=54 RepID=A0A1I1ZTY0_9BACT|nr:hypothetical protein [Nannocystis exedens]PCC75366.1 hypothetical protein NAEX_08476 [Nannocystis exedens]SFE33990.1 hypothetical protein SAMN02745121_03908 [Nannocystis exedens]
MTEPRDDLPALDPRAAALLATYRRGRAMPPAARARVQDRLSGTGPKAHVLPLMSRSDRGTARGTAWAVALALAAAVLLWLARRGPDLAERTGDAATMSPAHAVPTAPSGASLVAPPLIDPRPEPALAPAAAPAPAVDVVRPRTRPAGPAPARDPATSEGRGAPTPASTDLDGAAARPQIDRRDEDPADASTDLDGAAPPATDLRGEQALLARGWQSLAQGDARAAARDAGEHARRWPAGVLAPERRALAAAAACVDDPSRGAELARAFLADHPRSPLARRVRDACDLAP